ncbi:MAG TPA: hypothetical protein VI248_02705 [Kineosporiaceae bacterium]
MEEFEESLPSLNTSACTCAVSSPTVTSSASIRASLDDNGPGLTASDCLHAFTPGHRGSAAADPDGADLGLALARWLARSADGDVQARPATAATPGGHLEVRLPLLPGQHQSQHPVSSPHPAPP